MIKQKILNFDKKYFNSYIINFYLEVKYFLKIQKIYFLLNFNFNKLSRNHNLKKELIISLTTYQKRFKTLPLILSSLLNQTVKPDKIEVWIEESEYGLIPQKLFKFKNIKFKICKNNLFSYKKILPALAENKDRYIVTFDDDVIYPKFALEYLVNKSLEYPNDVIANRIHKIKVEGNIPEKYNSWQMNNNSNDNLNFFTGVGGVLYPPNCFYKDISNINKMKKICPNNDDIWLNWMIKLNNLNIIHSGLRENFVMIKTIKTGLFKKNVKQNYNDVQIKNIIQQYGFPHIKS